MLAAVRAALAGQGAVIGAAAPIAATVAAIAAADESFVLVIAGPDLPAVERAMLLAAIGPLAVARAPRRVCALDVATGASATDGVAAARFLADAGSTTGQVLAVG